MIQLEDVHRSAARDWPLFHAVDTQFGILSLSVARADEEYGNDASRRRCAALVESAFHSLSPNSDLIVETLVRVRGGGRTASSKLLARRSGIWPTLKSPIELPVGERTETAIDVSEGVEFLGRIQTTIDQLDECLELSRELNSGTFIPTSSQADSSALETSFSTSTDGTHAGHPNQSWAVLAPAAIQAGYCALRATGWFDDRASGIDIFGENAFLDQLEPSLRAAFEN